MILRLLIALSLVLALSTDFACAPQGDSSGSASDILIPQPRPALAAIPGNLQLRIEAALSHVAKRDLLTTNGFWTVFHGILGTGFDITLYNPETKERVNAIDYICKGGKIRAMEFIETGDGLDVRTGGELFVGQGHQDQFVAEMTQWGMPIDKKFRVNNKDYTFRDFVRHSLARARVTEVEGEKQELSWAILIVGQFYGTNYKWVNNRGETLAFEDMVRYELNESIDSAACGGTHRLFGLTWVYYLHLKNGGKVEGVWKEVADKIARYKKIAKDLQNPDGSFSTEYFKEPGSVKNAQQRISSSGHILEWLALASTDAELREPWMENAASALALLILENQDAEIEGGALYHAAHGLHIYRDRVFGSKGSRGPVIPLPERR